jgi:hypothetical protein
LFKFANFDKFNIASNEFNKKIIELMEKRNGLLAPSIILGLVLIICTLILAGTWRKNYSAQETITVTGSASKDIISDLGVFKATLTANAPTQEAAYRKLENEKPILSLYLKSNGISSDSIEWNTINSYPIYEISPSGHQTSNVRDYVYNQMLQFQLKDVYKIKKISVDAASLVEKDVEINVEQPEYHYTKISGLKIEMQAEAAKDAMIRAEKIAKATGRSLGPMRSARMGVIQITPELSNQVSNYGIDDITSINKEITTVVGASFEIE